MTQSIWLRFCIHADAILNLDCLLHLQTEVNIRWGSSIQLVHHNPISLLHSQRVEIGVLQKPEDGLGVLLLVSSQMRDMSGLVPAFCHDPGVRSAGGGGLPALLEDLLLEVLVRDVEVGLAVEEELGVGVVRLVAEEVSAPLAVDLAQLDGETLQGSKIVRPASLDQNSIGKGQGLA